MQTNTKDSVEMSGTALSRFNLASVERKKKHCEILLKGVDVWNAWLATQADELAIDLNEANLSHANLAGANLNHASLIGADLTHAQLSNANLNGANLLDANLMDARLEGANLKCTTLTSANLIRAKLAHTNLTHANLENVNLTQANLTDADLTHANLTLANLQEANLERVNLNDSNLSFANLGYTHLYGANLEDTNLFRANLTHSNLTRTSLAQANLTQADLSHTRLEQTNLRQARLSATVLTGAEFCETILSSTCLNDSIGLGDTIHSGPSTMDHRTLEQSALLPVKFLRGCGLPDAIIYSGNSLPSRRQSLRSCYISYSPSDKVFAQRLQDKLQNHGIRCWLDEHRIVSGNEYQDPKKQDTKRRSKVLLCVSKASAERWWFADTIERQNNGVSLVPLNLDGHLFNENTEREYAGKLATQPAADFTGWQNDTDRFEHGFAFVVNALTEEGNFHPSQ